MRRCFYHTDLYKMQYFTIFQDKLHSFNIQDHRNTLGLLAKKSPICNLQRNLKELRFNMINNLLRLLIY